MEFQQLLTRRTIRLFQQRTLSEDDFIAMIDAARLAPCASNLQRLRYIAVLSKEKVEAILTHTSYAGLVKPNRDPEIGRTAPAAFLAVTATGKPNSHLYADAGAAIMSIEFAAWNRGIGCCWLGSFMPSKVAPILDFPFPDRILFLVAMGYPAEQPCREDIVKGGSPAYYLDKNNTLHVPKFTTETLLTVK